jgi:hypothetical protein
MRLFDTEASSHYYAFTEGIRLPLSNSDIHNARVLSAENSFEEEVY